MPDPRGVQAEAVAARDVRGQRVADHPRAFQRRSGPLGGGLEDPGVRLPAGLAVRDAHDVDVRAEADRLDLRQLELGEAVGDDPDPPPGVAQRLQSVEDALIGHEQLDQPPPVVGQQLDRVVGQAEAVGDVAERLHRRVPPEVLLPEPLPGPGSERAPLDQLVGPRGERVVGGDQGVVEVEERETGHDFEIN